MTLLAWIYSQVVWVSYQQIQAMTKWKHSGKENAIVFLSFIPSFFFIFEKGGGPGIWTQSLFHANMHSTTKLHHHSSMDCFHFNINFPNIH